MVLTVGDIKRVRVSVYPYELKASMAPVNDYTDEGTVYSTVKVTNNSSDNESIYVYYDINELNDKKYDVDSLNSKIIKAEQDLNLARDLWKRKSSAEKEIKSINQELKNLEKEFELLKDELGVCPLCGNELKGK